MRGRRRQVFRDKRIAVIGVLFVVFGWVVDRFSIWPARSGLLLPLSVNDRAARVRTYGSKRSPLTGSIPIPQ